MNHPLKTMTHEEKINYMRLACGLCGFHMRTQDMDLLVSMYEGILEKKGAFNLADGVMVETLVKGRELRRQVEVKDGQLHEFPADRMERELNG